MVWNDQVVEQLAVARAWTYRRSGESYAEPAALTSLSLIGAGRIQESSASAEWLASIQAGDGSVGVSKAESSPCWPTGLAISAWCSWQHATGEARFASNIKTAIDWTLGHQGKTLPQHSGIGHNTSLRGWSWALDTHAWLEPTAMAITGLHHSGKHHHPLTMEAGRLILDRQLPQGGFNYGNTAVLGQLLLPRVQPTGIALAALALANIDKSRVQKSLSYLQQQWPTLNSTASLCYAAIGLAAYGAVPESLEEKLHDRYLLWMKRKGCTYKLALIALAAQKEQCLLARKNLAHDDTKNAL